MSEPWCQTKENPPVFTESSLMYHSPGSVDTQIIYHKPISMKFLHSFRRLLRFLFRNDDPGNTVLKMLSGKELGPRRWWFWYLSLLVIGILRIRVYPWSHLHCFEFTKPRYLHGLLLSNRLELDRTFVRMESKYIVILWGDAQNDKVDTHTKPHVISSRILIYIMCDSPQIIVQQSSFLFCPTIRLLFVNDKQCTSK